MDSTSYVRMLENNLLPYVKGKGWVEIGYSNRITIQNSQCSSRNPDLNPIVHLWNDVEKEVQRQKPSNIKALEAVMKKAWTETPFERCANLVDSMPRRYY
uniref:DDE_3 domain-containing protein n=1 Tax=Heterorhabditis bacteriophora TaxID=37862 RepID=A0A1I7WXR1_HETBA